MARLGSSQQLGVVSSASSFHDISLEGEQAVRKQIQRSEILPCAP